MSIERRDGNDVRVEKELPHRGGFLSPRIIKGGSSSGITLPYMPLERALVAVRAYRNASEVTKRLIQLHYDAMGRLGSESALILLSKALELTAAILPGRTRADKQALFPLKRVPILDTRCSGFSI